MTDPTVDLQNIPAAADSNVDNPTGTPSAPTPQASTVADDPKASGDDWASALEEQFGSEQTAAANADPARSASDAVFKPLSESEKGIGADIKMIMDVPMQLTVELGRTRLTIKNLLQLGQGSVVELDGLAGEPMDKPSSKKRFV